jgi:hypothetical protein
MRDEGDLLTLIKDVMEHPEDGLGLIALALIAGCTVLAVAAFS